jgi:hypothetical protein
VRVCERERQLYVNLILDLQPISLINPIINPNDL